MSSTGGPSMFPMALILQKNLEDQFRFFVHSFIHSSIDKEEAEEQARDTQVDRTLYNPRA